MHEGFPFSPPTELLEPINATSTSLRVKNPDAFPDAPNQATLGIDENGETVRYATKVGDTLGGLTRGFDTKNGFGVARAWIIGTPIQCTLTAEKINAMQENIRTLDADVASESAARQTHEDRKDNPHEVAAAQVPILPAIAEQLTASPASAEEAVVAIISTMPEQVINNVSIDELQATIDSLPKLINRIITINVLPGTTTDEILLEGFFGSGTIVINGAAATGTTHTVQRFTLHRCTLGLIELNGFNTSATTGYAVLIGGGTSSGVELLRMNITGGVNTTAGNMGVASYGIGRVAVADNCVISNKNIAVLIWAGATAAIMSLSGTNNNIVFQASRSVITVHNNVAQTITGLRLCSEINAGMVVLPRSSITLSTTMANLQTFIEGLPRRLAAAVTVNVSAGTLAGVLSISNFHGGGRLNIEGAAGIATTHNCLRVVINDNVLSEVQIRGFNTTEANVRSFDIIRSNNALITNCRVAAGVSTNSGNVGVRAYKTNVHVDTSLLQNQYAAIVADSNSRVQCVNLSGTGNFRAYLAATRGALARSGTTPTASVMDFVTTGGTITRPSGIIQGT